MAVSYCKYGAAADAYPHRVSAINSLLARVQKYQDTGNTEWLMDVANFAMIEFMYPPDGSCYTPTDSAASPGRVWHGGRTHHGANDNRDGAAFYRREGD